ARPARDDLTLLGNRARGTGFEAMRMEAKSANFVGVGYSEFRGVVSRPCHPTSERSLPRCSIAHRAARRRPGLPGGIAHGVAHRIGCRRQNRCVRRLKPARLAKPARDRPKGRKRVPANNLIPVLTAAIFGPRLRARWQAMTSQWKARNTDRVTTLEE